MDNEDKMLLRLIELQNFDDYEEAHVEADNILCDLLESLGFNRMVEEYWKVPKWYA